MCFLADLCSILVRWPILLVAWLLAFQMIKRSRHAGHSVQFINGRSLTAGRLAIQLSCKLAQLASPQHLAATAAALLSAAAAARLSAAATFPVPLLAAAAALARGRPQPAAAPAVPACIEAAAASSKWHRLLAKQPEHSPCGHKAAQLMRSKAQLLTSHCTSNLPRHSAAADHSARN